MEWEPIHRILERHTPSSPRRIHKIIHPRRSGQDLRRQFQVLDRLHDERCPAEHILVGGLGAIHERLAPVATVVDVPSDPLGLNEAKVLEKCIRLFNVLVFVVDVRGAHQADLALRQSGSHDHGRCDCLLRRRNRAQYAAFLKLGGHGSGLLHHVIRCQKDSVSTVDEWGIRVGVPEWQFGRCF